VPSSYTLGEHFEDFVKDLVSGGRYASASEVLRDGLRLLEEREKVREAKLAALRADIGEGLASGRSGELDMSEIKEEARAQRRAAAKAIVHGA
jgi:antitoxin ParD1/3/4